MVCLAINLAFWLESDTCCTLRVRPFLASSVNTDQPAEDNLSGGSIDMALIGLDISLQMQQRPCNETMQLAKLILVKAIRLTEPVKDHDSLGRWSPNSTSLLKHLVGLSIGRLDVSGINELLTQISGCVLVHGEGCCGGGDDGARWVARIRHTI